jgi:hypothetical protein
VKQERVIKTFSSYCAMEPNLIPVLFL